jgi:uncharacterized alkaline shock family protein YloU
MSEEVKNTNASPETTILDDTELGDIRIHEGVIASLARRAVLSIPGVSRLAGNSLVDNIAEIVGSRRMPSNVTITLGDDNDVAIEIKVVFKFGFRIPEVSMAIQKAVINDVENTTGMNVTSVHVIVQDIEEVSAPQAAQEQSDQGQQA